MRNYEALENFLREHGGELVPFTFAEIEQILGHDLRPSARKHRAWWSNNPSNNPMTHAWLRAGYKSAAVDMKNETLIFKKAM